MGMNNELIERLDLWIAEYDRPAYSQIVLLLKDCKKALETKPVGEPVAFRANVDGVWFVASTHKFMKATLEKSDVTAEIHPLYESPPSIDTLIAEIDLLKITEYEISRHPWIESAYELSEVKAILDKWRTK